MAPLTVQFSAAEFDKGRFLGTQGSADGLGAGFEQRFRDPAGQAEMIKKQLLAQGAHTSVAPEAASNDALNKATAKEQKQ